MIYNTYLRNLFCNILNFFHEIFHGLVDIKLLYRVTNKSQETTQCDNKQLKRYLLQRWRAVAVIDVDVEVDVDYCLLLWPALTIRNIRSLDRCQQPSQFFVSVDSLLQRIILLCATYITYK